MVDPLPVGAQQAKQEAWKDHLPCSLLFDPGHCRTEWGLPVWGDS